MNNKKTIEYLMANREQILDDIAMLEDIIMHLQFIVDIVSTKDPEYACLIGASSIKLINSVHHWLNNEMDDGKE